MGTAPRVKREGSPFGLQQCNSTGSCHETNFSWDCHRFKVGGTLGSGRSAAPSLESLKTVWVQAQIFGGSAVALSHPINLEFLG